MQMLLWQQNTSVNWCQSHSSPSTPHTSPHTPHTHALQQRQCFYCLPDNHLSHPVGTYSFLYFLNLPLSPPSMHLGLPHLSSSSILTVFSCILPSSPVFFSCLLLSSSVFLNTTTYCKGYHQSLVCVLCMCMCVVCICLVCVSCVAHGIPYTACIPPSPSVCVQPLQYGESTKGGGGGGSYSCQSYNLST